MPAYDPKIVIVGGGIAGLTTGLCLTHAIPGIQPVILERHAALTSIGGPIIMPPNGTRVFKSLGLLSSLSAMAQSCAVRTLVRGTSGEVVQENVVASGDEAPYLLIMRGELLAWLHGEVCARGGVVRFGQAVVAVDEGDDVVRVRTAGGRFEADMVVVCDGVRSTLRASVIPDFKARVAVSSTSSVTGCDIPAALMLRDPVLAGLYRRKGPTVWMGPDRYLVTASMPAHGLYCVAFFDNGEPVAAHSDWVVAGDLDRVKTRFGAFVGGGAAELIDAAVAARDTMHQKCVNWTSVGVGPFSTWRSRGGRVILHGDAVHAMLPDAGQGATQCIESSASLALFCRTATSAADIPLVTARQEAFRKPRAEKVQLIGQLNSTTFRMKRYEHVGQDNGDEVDVVDAEHFAWLYEYDVLKEAARYLKAVDNINVDDI